MSSELDFKLQGEAVHHSNWLPNRAPSSRINGKTPILLWNVNTRIDFKWIPEFGQKGYSFLYQPKNAAHNKLLPRSVFGYFVGMESEVTLCRA